MQLARSLLYVPANRDKFPENAMGLFVKFSAMTASQIHR